MQIQKLILENFSVIMHCMHSDYLEIDFSQAENKICLLIGPNGSGKTTILSLLNPFASLGNLDVRDGYPVILEGQRGRKEIVLELGDDVYSIQHFYTPNKQTHSVKSYIQRNGEELNPNGNVTSFKELIRITFGLQLDYLRLIRLGDNVKSLIDNTTAERKTFMSKLLDDIGIYLQYFKHVNKNMNTLTGMIKHTMTNLNQCKYGTKEEYKEALAQLKTKMEEDAKILLDAQLQENTYKVKIEEYAPYTEIRAELQSTQKVLKKMEKVLDSQEKLSSEECKERLQAIEDEVHKLTWFEGTYDSQIKAELEKKEIYEQQLYKVRARLAEAKNQKNTLDGYQQNLDDVKEALERSKKRLGNFSTSLTEELVSNFIIYLKTSQRTLDQLAEYGPEIIGKCLDLISRDKSVKSYVSKGLLSVSDSAQLEAAIQTLLKISAREIPVSCTEMECGARKLHEYLREMKTEHTDQGGHTQEFYQGIEAVYAPLKNIVNGLQDYEATIDQLPARLSMEFTKDRLSERLKKDLQFYPADEMDAFYSAVVELTRYYELEEKKHELKATIKQYIKISGYDLLEDECQQTEDRLQATIENIDKLRTSAKHNKERLQELDYDKEHYQTVLETAEHYEETRDHAATLLQQMETLQTYMTELGRAQETIMRYKVLCKKNEDDYHQLEKGYDLFKSYKKSLNKFTKHYENMDLVKNALSSTKDGIPNLISKHYLQSVLVTANNLLKIAFDGNIIIEQFNITADEFTIPVYNHGTRLPDVKLVSQGEKSLFSICLSFAMVAQSLEKYDIIALDELSGPLDTENKRRFLYILEQMIDQMQLQQIFLITHDEMFSNYPVDIIDLHQQSDHANYQMANFLPIHLSPQ